MLPATPAHVYEKCPYCGNKLADYEKPIAATPQPQDKGEENKCKLAHTAASDS